MNFAEIPVILTHDSWGSTHIPPCQKSATIGLTEYISDKLSTIYVREARNNFANRFHPWQKQSQLTRKSCLLSHMPAWLKRSANMGEPIAEIQPFSVSKDVGHYSLLLLSFCVHDIANSSCPST